MPFVQSDASIYIKKKRWLRLMTIGILVIVFLYLGKATTLMDPMRLWIFNDVYTPIVTAVTTPVLWLKKYSLSQKDKTQLLLENKQLLVENKQLRAKVQMLSYFQDENIRLKRLMQSIAIINTPGKIVEIVNTNIEGYLGEISINKGSAEGVRENQALIDPYGLVGQVIEVYPHQSKAILITDGRSRVPVYVKRTLQRALVSGSDHKYELDLPLVSLDSDFEVGDELLSSGLGGIFPRGYPVARVVAVNRNSSDEFLQVKLAPYAHLTSMLEILLVDQQSIDDIQSLEVIPIGPPAPVPRKENLQQEPVHE